MNYVAYARYAPVIEQHYGLKLGISYIPPVIPTLSGALYVETEQEVVALYTRVDAKHTYHYDRENVFRKLAQIYRMSEQIPERDTFNKETFPDQFIARFEQEWANFQERYEASEEARDIQRIIAPYEDFLSVCAKESRQLVAEAQAQQSKFYLTHSDYTNNVLVSTSGEHYLIDFDEALFGPIERDGFLSMGMQNEESKLWLSMIREAFPDYEPNEAFIRYYLFERFMVDLATFLQESIEHPDQAHRQKVVSSTREYLFGWLYPMIMKYR